MILLHIPHSSTVIPNQYREQFLLNDEQLKFETHLMADIFTEDLAKNFKEEQLVSKVSRIVCDVERFRNDNDEEMSARGMGVVYTKTHDLKQLRRPDVDSEQIKRDVYDKHHALFERKVREMLDKHGKCFIVDLHSYADKALPYELHQEDERPDLCLGFEDYHIDKKKLAAVRQLCINAGYTVFENQPFKGSIVPLSLYKKDKRVQSLMIEINKRTYLKDFNKVDHKFAKLQKLLNDILEAIKSHE